MKILVKVPFRFALFGASVKLRSGVYRVVDDEPPDYINTVSEDDAAYLVSQNLAEPVRHKRAPQNKKLDAPANK